MAAAACAVLWPELRLELEALGPGWMTASDFFASPDTVDGLLAHERRSVPAPMGLSWTGADPRL